MVEVTATHHSEGDGPSIKFGWGHDSVRISAKKYMSVYLMVMVHHLPLSFPSHVVVTNVIALMLMNISIVVLLLDTRKRSHK